MTDLEQWEQVVRDTLRDRADRVPHIQLLALPPSPARGRRRERRRWIAVAATVSSVAVIAGVVALVAALPRTPGKGSAASNGSVLPSCVVPRVARRKPVLGTAGDAVVGSRFVRRLTLGGDDLEIDPAPASTHPAVSADLALCNLLAARTIHGFNIAPSTRTLGLTFGLGELSLADHLYRSGGPSSVVSPAPLPATQPALPRYHRRLAWIAVTIPAFVTDCGAGSASPPSPPLSTPTAPKPNDIGYQVIAIDANTGAAGVIYQAAMPAPCTDTIVPAYLDTPVEDVSVPWTLQSRDGSQSAVLSFPLGRCDSFPTTIVSRGNPGVVTVAVVRPFAACGPPGTLSQTLYPAIEGSTLPKRLIHARTGAEDSS